MDWEYVAKLMPIATATIALCAFGAAVYSVWSQREVARKRAAVDFFLKTDLDEKMFDAYKASREGFKLLRAGVALDAFVKSDHYEKVYKYLNVHELLAVGIHRDVFDDHVAYHFWVDSLMGDYKDARSLIAHIRRDANEGSAITFADLEKLYDRWRKRRESDAAERTT